MGVSPRSGFVQPLGREGPPASCACRYPPRLRRSGGPSPQTLALKTVNRRALTIVVSLFGLGTLALFAWPFLASLSPSDTAGQSLPHLKINALGPGEYAYFDAGSNGRWSENHFLVIRQLDGAFDVFVLQTREGKFLMPDFHWWSSSGTCAQLSLPLPAGRLAPNGEIRCLDESPDGGNNDSWRWTYKGKNVKKFFSDFYSPQFVVEDGEIVVGKWR
jgi:hypothetical protein